MKIYVKTRDDMFLLLHSFNVLITSATKSGYNTPEIVETSQGFNIHFNKLILECVLMEDKYGIRF